MDVLSDVVTAMRVGEPHSARVTHRAPFGWQLPAVDAAGFHVVLAGTCWLLPPTGDPIMLRPGDIVFLPSGCAHALADDPATPLHPATTTLRRVDPGQAASPAPTSEPRLETVLLCGAYLLDPSRSHPILADLPQVIHLPAPTTRHTPAGTIVDLLEGELISNHPGRDALLRALLDALLLHILRGWLDQQANSGTDARWSAALHDPAVATALSAIHGSPGHGWTIAELADHAGLSRASFARRFTTLIGRPPIAYLTWWRMTLAARHLRDTDTPISTIARHAGYTSEFAFSHAFKSEFGCPPGRFRKQTPLAQLSNPELSTDQHPPAHTATRATKSET